MSTRSEHNAHWGVERQPDEQVSLGGYGELDQGDVRCPACWHGHEHTWREHDKWLLELRKREIQVELKERT